MKRATNAAPLSEPAIEKISALLEDEPEPAVLAVLHISRPTLGRALARLPLQYATRFMIEQRVAQLDGGADVG